MKLQNGNDDGFVRKILGNCRNFAAQIQLNPDEYNHKTNKQNHLFRNVQDSLLPPPASIAGRGTTNWSHCSVVLKVTIPSISGSCHISTSVESNKHCMGYLAVCLFVSYLYRFQLNCCFIFVCCTVLSSGTVSYTCCYKCPSVSI